MNDTTRKIIYLKDLIKKYNLDMSGLTVFIGFATNDYVFTSIAASLAGAKVYEYNPSLKNSYKEDYKTGICKVNNKEKIIFADIVINSKYFRPITKQEICLMKPTAVIAAMMSLDQVRKRDIDFKTCKKRNIEIVGIDEEERGILDSIGFKLFKVLFNAGFSIWNDNYLLLSSGGIGKRLHEFMERNKITCDLNYPSRETQKYDAIIISEYYKKDVKKQLKSIINNFGVDRYTKIINISGNLEVNEIAKSGFNVFPAEQSPLGHTTVAGDYLGHKVVFELNVASLAEATAVVRKNLKSIIIS